MTERLKLVDDPPYQECAACGYTWISDDETCPACGVFGAPIDARTAMLIDWPEFWARDPSTEDWLIWPLLPAGRGAALYAPAKAGKSLIVLALAALAATGGKGLDGCHREPVDVLYLDFEMTLDDLQERLEAFGYGPSSDLSRLHYASLPSLPPLNTAEGAKAVLELVTLTGAKVVIIDTFGRAVDGEENSNDVARDFYRWTGLALKAIQVAFLRTDHSGKDATKGMRGGSAKADDVDIVWQLTRVQSGVMLKATHRRIGWVPETVSINVDDSNGWELSAVKDVSYPAGTKEVAELLDRLGVRSDDSFTVANREIKLADPEGKGRGKALVLAAQRYRRSMDEIAFAQQIGSETGLIDTLSEPAPGTETETAPLPGSEPVQNRPEPAPPDMGLPGFPPIGGTGTVPAPEPTTEEPECPF